MKSNLGERRIDESVAYLEAGAAGMGENRRGSHFFAGAATLQHIINGLEHTGREKELRDALCT